MTAAIWDALTDEEASALGDHYVRNLRSLQSEEGGLGIIALLACKGSNKEHLLRPQYDTLMLSYENYRREQAFSTSPLLGSDLNTLFADMTHPVDQYFAGV